MNYSDWVDTPGMKFVLEELVPEAADALTSENFYEPVLLTGPSGVGKTYVVKRILTECKFQEQDTLLVNCAAFPRDLMESELFGYVKGAFTGASKYKPGLVDAPGKKVLVLDEIGTLPQHVQAKLLVFVETGDFRKVGAVENTHSYMKIIAVTNEEPSNNSFREDFLNRFHRIRIPALHERRPDVLHLLKYFAPNTRWTNRDLVRLLTYHWPGNVRELRRFARLVERYRNHEGSFFPKTGSVLTYFRSRRGLQYGLERPMPTEGVLGESLFTKPPGFLSRPTWVKSVETFCPNLSFRVENPKDVRLLSSYDSKGRVPTIEQMETESELALNSLDEDSPPEHTGDENNKPGEIEVREYSWEREWEIWCELFGQDPRHDGDILQCLEKGTRTRKPNEPSFLDWDDDDTLLERFKSTIMRIGRELDEASAKISMEPRNESETSAKNTHSRRRERDGDELDLEHLLKSLSPNDYKERWIEHWKPIGPAKAARRFSLNEKTVGRWFRNHKESKPSETES